MDVLGIVELRESWIGLILVGGGCRRFKFELKIGFFENVQIYLFG